MGQVASVVRTLSCQDCARYVCNAMDIRSECCGLCTCQYHTDVVEPPDDDSTFSLTMDGCCAVRESH